MARQARRKSNTGIYHIMLKGMDGRDIFLDNEDRETFIEKLLSARERSGFKLYGYCLMDNHIHLLMEENEEIGTSVKRITVGYVQLHNNKYARRGHLFQNRYRSETVETEGYLVTVLRYIHNNPVKAGIVKDVEGYRWSSYNQYLLSYEGKNVHIDTQLIRGYFKTLKDFEHYMKAENDDECLEYKPLRKYTDDGLREMICKQYNIDVLEELQLDEKKKLISKIYKNTGTSIRQLGRVLGVGKNIVERAIK